MSAHKTVQAQQLVERQGLTARLRRGQQALRLAWESSPGTAGLWMVLLALCSMLPLCVAWVGKSIVDAVALHSVGAALSWVGVELALLVVLGAAQRGATVTRQLMGTRLGLFVSLKILRKALTASLLQFQDPRFYDQLLRARREAGSRPLAMTAEVLGLLSALVQLVGLSILLVRFSYVALLMLFLMAFPSTLAELRFSRVTYDLRNRHVTDARKLSYLEYVLASDEHAKEVMLLGLGPTLLSRYEALCQKLWSEEKSLSLRRTLVVTSLAQLGTLSFYGCYLYIVYRAAFGLLTLGDMTLYVLAFRQGQQTFQTILLGLGAIYEHDLYMSNLLSFLSLPTEPPRKLLPPKQNPDHSERGIRFEDVGFRYPDQTTFALRHISLWIPAGQSLALVGHNGAGKTTFIKLLTGLYEPTEGRILLDGQDLRTLDPVELRRRLAVTFQDFNQYQLSARDNIAYGDPAHAKEDARVMKAVASAGAETIISGLPNGLLTQLGRQFESGVELSGGQWQRIALARTLMRCDADIIVLDEPTAALDVDAEAEVFQRVRKQAQGRTLILISHRFPSVRMADRIVVLDRSGIQEAGSHAELMSQEGLYAAMFRKQAQGYVD